MTNAQFDLEAMMNAQFEASKFYMMLAVGCSFVVLGAGMYVTVANTYESLLALLSAFLTVMSVIFIWRSERLRDVAEAILRKFEFYRGLGWDISSKEIVDLLATAPRSVRKAAMSLNPTRHILAVQSRIRLLSFLIILKKASGGLNSSPIA